MERKTIDTVRDVHWANVRLVRSRIKGMPKAERLACYREMRAGFLASLFLVIRRAADEAAAE